LARRAIGDPLAADCEHPRREEAVLERRADCDCGHRRKFPVNLALPYSLLPGFFWQPVAVLVPQRDMRIRADTAAFGPIPESYL
jgi:hypothetical protein